MLENKYYNYILLDPRIKYEWVYKNNKFDYAPFYVGKGCNLRVKSHYSQFDGSNLVKESIIKELKAGGYIPMYKIINENSSEEDSFNEEINLIKYIRENYSDIKLTNILEGGTLPPIHYGKDNPKARKVYLYDKDTGELLNEFECIADAMRNLGYKDGGYKVSHICDCCSGKRRTFANYKWSYDKLEKIEPNTGKWDRIKFTTLIAYNDKEMHEFTSMKDAYEFLGILNKGKINKALKSNTKFYKGYYWKIK